jgi:hypothetical protein
MMLLWVDLDDRALPKKARMEFKLSGTSSRGISCPLHPVLIMRDTVCPQYPHRDVAYGPLKNYAFHPSPPSGVGCMVTMTWPDERFQAAKRRIAPAPQLAVECSTLPCLFEVGEAEIFVSKVSQGSPSITRQR